MDQLIWRVAVQAPRSARGTTSLAYAGEFAIKRPHGTPSNACPTTRSSRDSAWKEVVRKVSTYTLGCKTHEEGNENRGDHDNQAQESCPAVANTVRDRSSDEDTNEGTTLARLEQCTLPFGGDDMTRRNQHTESLLEGTLSDEIAVQEHVEGLHDLIGVSHSSWIAIWVNVQ